MQSKAEAKEWNPFFVLYQALKVLLKASKKFERSIKMVINKRYVNGSYDCIFTTNEKWQKDISDIHKRKDSLENVGNNEVHLWIWSFWGVEVTDKLPA